MHGHSYRVAVLVRGPIGAMGWVCDFAEIDAVARPIIATLDHSTLNDTLPIPENSDPIVSDRVTAPSRRTRTPSRSS